MLKNAMGGLLFTLVLANGLYAQARSVREDFDLVAQGRDANGILLNPSWKTNEDPRTLDPAKRCGILALRGTPGYRSVLLRKPECFGDRQRAILRLNEPRHLVAKGVACGQAVRDGSPHGHLNWVPVTMEGALIFDDRQTGFGGDYDLTFEFVPTGRAPSTKWNGDPDVLFRFPATRSPVHLEFDYRETTNRLRQNVTPSWWTEFSEASSNHDAADALLGIGSAVVTGLFNLDLVHYGHSEVHPVFGLAVLVSADTVSQSRIRHRWVFLARDRGNQGNCATRGAMPFRFGAVTDPTNQFRVRFDAPGGASGKPTVLKNRSWIGISNPLMVGPAFKWSQNEGLQMEVAWPRPEAGLKDAVMLGDLIVEWSGNFVAPVIAARMSAAVDSARAIRAMDVAGLTPAYYKRQSQEPYAVDSVFYAQLDPIVDWTGWSETVESVLQLPVADSLPFAPAEVFDLSPPVQSCSAVSISENPRCRGNWRIAPDVGASPWDSRDHRQFSTGLSVENVRFRLGAGFVRPRLAFGYVWREGPDSTGVRTTEQLGTGQFQVLLGPVRRWVTVYGIVSLGGGVKLTDSWKPFVLSEFGLGMPIRSGTAVGADIEFTRTARSAGPDYWRLSLRVPIVVF